MPEEKKIENPLRWLTKFLTRPSEGLKDSKTDFPTYELVQAQLYHRYMAKQYKIKEADDFADTLAVAMWSFKRKSRTEAVAGIYGQREKRVPPILETLEDIVVRPPEGTPRKEE